MKCMEYQTLPPHVTQHSGFVLLNVLRWTICSYTDTHTHTDTHTFTHLSTSCITEDNWEVQTVHQDGTVKINSKGANTIMYRSINIAVISW